MALSGSSIRDIAMEHPSTFIRYNRGIIALQQIAVVPRGNSEDDATVCFVIVGGAGTGKTSIMLAIAEALGFGIYSLPSAKSSGTYWQDYQPGQTVIIDEMGGDRFKPTFFNRLIDKGPMHVPVYGGERVFNSRFVLVTSNTHPRLWWPNAASFAALRRRVLVLPPSFRRPVPDREPWSRRRLYYGPEISPLSRPMCQVFVSNSPLLALRPWDYGYPQ